MEISLIAALDEDGVIGLKTGGLPWKLPAEAAHFRAYCLGKWILLGRRTFAEMEGWFSTHTALVLTKAPEKIAPPGIAVTTVEQALAAAQAGGAAELVVAGGAEVFSLTLPVATRLLLTTVHYHSGGDVFFPRLPQAAWELTSERHHPATVNNPLPFTIRTYTRARP